MSEKEIKVKSEPADDMDIPENFFDDLTSNKFLDDLVSCIPVPKTEVLSEGECSEEEKNSSKNLRLAADVNCKPDQSVEVSPLPEKKLCQKDDLIEHCEVKKSSAYGSAQPNAVTVFKENSAGAVSTENEQILQQPNTFANYNAAIPIAVTKSELTETHHSNDSGTNKIACTLPQPIQIIKTEPGKCQSQLYSADKQDGSKPVEQQLQPQAIEHVIKAELVYQHQPSESERMYQQPDSELIYQEPEPEPRFQTAELESMYQPPEIESLYQSPKHEPCGQLSEPGRPDEIIPRPEIKNFPIPIKMCAPGIKREKKSPSPPIQMIPFKKIKLEKQTNSYIEKAYKTCVDVLRMFKEEEKRRFITKFVFTPTTIRIKNLDDEYQSPLLRNNNIEFNFTSTNSKIDFRKMSIMRFGKEVTRVVDLLGLDINNVAKKVLRAKSSKNSVGGQSASAETSSGQYYAPFYNEVATQTETIACNECLIRKLKSHKDKEVMVKPQTEGIGIQTGMENELPIMSIITTLNTYQQVALNDFAEVMKEPPPTDPNDIYRLRERLMDILNLSRRSVSRLVDPRPRTNVYVQPAAVQNMIPLPMHQTNAAPNAYSYPGNQPMMHPLPSSYHENDHHMVAPRPPNFSQNHQNMMPNHQGLSQHQGYPHPQLKREHSSHMAPSTSSPNDDPRRRQKLTDNIHDPSYMSSYQLQSQHELQSSSFDEMPSMMTPYNNRSFGRGGKIMRK